MKVEIRQIIITVSPGEARVLAVGLDMWLRLMAKDAKADGRDFFAEKDEYLRMFHRLTTVSGMHTRYAHVVEDITSILSSDDAESSPIADHIQTENQEK